MASLALWVCCIQLDREFIGRVIHGHSTGGSWYSFMLVQRLDWSVDKGDGPGDLVKA